jgi:hypothetical protein
MIKPPDHQRGRYVCRACAGCRQAKTSHRRQSTPCPPPTGCRSDCADASTTRSRPKRWRAGDRPPITSTRWWRWSTTTSRSATTWPHTKPAIHPSRRDRRPGEWTAAEGRTWSREHRFCATTSASTLRPCCPTSNSSPPRSRMVGWYRMLAEGTIGVHYVDVRAIHQHLFADVYTWAGNYRVTELRRGDYVFAWQSALGRLLEETARALATNGAGLDQPGLAYRLARLYADYNHIHPFGGGQRPGGHAASAHRRHALRPSARSHRVVPRRVVRGVTGQHAVPPRRPAQPPAVPAVVLPGGYGLAGVALGARRGQRCAHALVRGQQ